MSHSYVSVLFHCTFSTKHRLPVIPETLQERLWPYLGGIARENGMRALEVGGVEDHAHVLLSLPATMPIAKAVQHCNPAMNCWAIVTFSASGDCTTNHTSVT